MSIEKKMRELVKKKGLRQTARELGIDSGSLYRSVQDGPNLRLGRIEQLLDYFGYGRRPPDGLPDQQERHDRQGRAMS